MILKTRHTVFAQQDNQELIWLCKVHGGSYFLVDNLALSDHVVDCQLVTLPGISSCNMIAYTAFVCRKCLHVALVYAQTKLRQQA